jgi:hypothetical protein
MDAETLIAAWFSQEEKLAYLANLEVGAAASIHPNAAAVETPGAIEDAVRVAALTNQTHPAARIDLTDVAAHVVRRTIHDLHTAAAGLPAAATAPNLEISAAATIDPNAPAVVTPSAAVVTRRPAALANQLHSAACVGRAQIASFVVRSTVNVVAVVPAAPIRPGNGEIGAAPAVDPNAPSVHVTPGLIEDARRVAALPNELDSASDIRAAIVALHVVGRAGDHRSLGQRVRRGLRAMYLGEHENDYGQGNQNNCGGIFHGPP